MVFRNHRTTTLSNIKVVSIAGVEIDQVAEARFLGVIIDQKLTWCKHIHAVRASLNRYMGIMFKIKRHLPLEVRLQIYHSFVQIPP